jgi:division protein CdvB (Snf7/Vps24/ESCRT-III family)
MPQDFTKKWESEQKEPVSNRIKEQVAPQEPLKQKLEGAKRKLNEEIVTLDRHYEKMQQKDDSINKQLIKAFEDHDTERAKLLAGELAELRKVKKQTQYGKYALEKASSRIEMAENVGDIAVALHDVNHVVRSVKGTLDEFLPAASGTMGELSTMMNDTMISFSNMLGDTSMMSPNNEDANKILAEAAAVAESRVKDKLPNAENYESGLHQ